MKNGKDHEKQNSVWTKSKIRKKKRYIDLQIQNIIIPDINPTAADNNGKTSSKNFDSDSYVYAPSSNELPLNNTQEKPRNLSPDSSNSKNSSVNLAGIDIENMEDVLHKIQVLKSQLQRFEAKFRNRLVKQNGSDINDLYVYKNIHKPHSGDFSLGDVNYGQLQQTGIRDKAIDVNSRQLQQTSIRDKASDVNYRQLQQTNIHDKAKPAAHTSSNFDKPDNAINLTDNKSVDTSPLSQYSTYVFASSTKAQKNKSNESVHTYFSSIGQKRISRKNQTENFACILNDLKHTAEDLQKKISTILQQIKKQNVLGDRQSERSLCSLFSGSRSSTEQKKLAGLMHIFDERHEEILRILKELEHKINNKMLPDMPCESKSNLSLKKKNSGSLKRKQSKKRVLDSVVFSHAPVNLKSTSSEDKCCPTCGKQLHKHKNEMSSDTDNTKKKTCSITRIRCKHCGRLHADGETCRKKKKKCCGCFSWCWCCRKSKKSRAKRK